MRRAGDITTFLCLGLSGAPDQSLFEKEEFANFAAEALACAELDDIVKSDRFWEQRIA